MLTQNPLTQERKLKLRWLVAVSSLPLLGVVTAFGIMPQSKVSAIGNKTVAREIVLPRTTQTVGHAVTFWRNDRVQRGDTVAEQLRRLNVDDADASSYLRKAPAAATFRKLAIGKSVQAETDADGNLLALRYPNSDGSQVVIS